MEIPTDLYRTIVEVVDMRVSEIKVTRSDFEDLKSVVKELADAQARTELRVEELAEAQARTEQRIERLAQAQEELAKAQARTERRIEELAQAQARTEKELRNLEKQVGGLSEKLGGSLEDLSYDVLPACLEKYYQVEVNELGRDYLIINGNEIEFNILVKEKINQLIKC